MLECLMYYSFLLLVIGCLRGLKILIYRLFGRKIPEPEPDPEELKWEHRRKEKRKERRKKILVWINIKRGKMEWKNGEVIC